MHHVTSAQFKLILGVITREAAADTKMHRRHSIRSSAAEEDSGAQSNYPRWNATRNRYRHKD